jgi:hypothetical protein
MGKNEYLRRIGQIYALHIQKGYTEEELLLYTEKVFSYLYRKDVDKR